MSFLVFLLVYFGIGYTTSPFIYMVDQEQSEEPDWWFLLIGWPVFWLYTFVISAWIVGDKYNPKPNKNSTNELGIGG